MTAQLSIPHPSSPIITLRPYQEEGRDFLAASKGAILADDMGLGKTVQALAASAGSPTFVVCPSSVVSVWEDTAVRIGLPVPQIVTYAKLPKASVTETKRFDGKRDKKSRKVHPRTMPKGSVLIVDEAHMAKNYTAARTENLFALIQGVQIAKGRTWLLTGTPLLNEPFELYNLLKMIMREECFGGFSGFLRLFNAKKKFFGGFEFKPTHEGLAEARERLMDRPHAPMLRRMKADVLTELPEKTYTYHQVKVPKDLHKYAPDDIRIAQSFEELSSIGEISTFRKLLAVEKYKASLDLIESFEAAREPLVVFSYHREPIHLLAQRKGWGVIHGEIGQTRRAETVSAFQAGKLSGIACTIQAGGIGITLTHASNAIVLDKAWTPALNLQAEDRIHRMGQSRGTVIHYIESDHMLDFHVNRILAGKREMIDAVFQ